MSDQHDDLQGRHDRANKKPPPDTVDLEARLEQLIAERVDALSQRIDELERELDRLKRDARP